jgi:hypothetical protein
VFSKISTAVVLHTVGSQVGMKRQRREQAWKAPEVRTTACSRDPWVQVPSVLPGPHSITSGFQI